MDEISSFAVILLLASISALLFRRFKVAPISAYIIVGLVVGPVFKIVDPSSRLIQFLSDIGIALISFQIGLGVKSDLILRYGPRVLLSFLLELIFAAFLSSIFGIIAGFPIAVTFVLLLIAVNSSAVVAFKLMEGRGVTDDLLFAIIVVVGTLEDAIVMAGITLIPTLAMLGKLMIGEAFSMLGNMIAIVFGMLVFGREILPKIIRFIIREGDIETLLLVILAVALGYGMIGGYMGLSFALGSFLAGVIVSTTEMPAVVMERLTSLRALFVIIFFISIGMSIPPIGSPLIFLVGSGLAAVIIIIKVISITFASWIAIGLSEALRIGLYMLPISELGIIVAREAYRVGLVDQNIFVSSALVVIISISVASRLSGKEDLIAKRLTLMLPTPMLVFMEKISSTTSVFLEKILVSKDCQQILISLGKKLLSTVAVLTLGSIIIQYIPTMELLPGLAFIIEAAVATAILLFSFIMVLKSRRDFERLIAWYTRSFEARTGVAGVIKNSFYILIFLFLGIMILLNMTSIIRRIIASYFNVGIASFTIFLIISSFIVLMIYIVFEKIRKMPTPRNVFRRL